MSVWKHMSVKSLKAHLLSLSLINKVTVFEEQEGDYKVNFEDAPDLGMAADI